MAEEPVSERRGDEVVSKFYYFGSSSSIVCTFGFSFL